MIAWFRRWGWFVLVIAGAVIGWLISRKRASPYPEIINELDVIRVDREITKLAAERGRAEALREIERRYGEEKAKLEEKERREAETLTEDPVALARFLVRAGARRRG